MSEGDDKGAKVVVLLTDGENNCGLHLPEQAASMAAQWGIRVYVISLGDMGDRQNMIVNGASFQTKSVMNDNAWLLKKMAESTGGIYRHADDFDSLLSVYEKIDALEKGRLQTKAWNDLFQPPPPLPCRPCSSC